MAKERGYILRKCNKNSCPPKFAPLLYTLRSEQNNSDNREKQKLQILVSANSYIFGDNLSRFVWNCYCFNSLTHI